MQNGPGGRFRWYKANCTEYNRSPFRAGLSPLIVLLSLLLLAPLPQYAPADTLAPPSASSHRRRPALPPDQRAVGSRWGRFRQGTFITGFRRFAPRHCRPLVRRAHVGLASGLMREGANRMNRLRRAVGFCRPSCNEAALDGFAWLSPWPTCGGCAARTGRPGVQLDAGRRKPGLPHLLHLRDWSGGLVLRL